MGKEEMLSPKKREEWFSAKIQSVLEQSYGRDGRKMCVLPLANTFNRCFSNRPEYVKDYIEMSF